MTTTTMTRSNDVTSLVKYECAKALLCADRGERETAREALIAAANELSQCSSPQPVEDYVTVVNCAHLIRCERDVADLVRSWILSDRYWDVLCSDVAAPAGSAMARIIYAAAAGTGHSKAIVLTFVLSKNGRASRDTLRQDADRLRRCPRAVRQAAGLLAPTWSGTLAELITAAQDSVHLSS